MRNPIVDEDLQFILSQKLPWYKLEGKTVLISGVGGFLSTYMVKVLLYCNEKNGSKIKVLGMVRNKEKALAKFSEYVGKNNFELIIQDVCDPVTIRQKVNYIIHAASFASPKYYGKDPVGTLSANVLGTYNLLQLAKKNKIEAFLFFSSGEVYGEVDQHCIPTKEDDYGYVDPLDVRSCYAESKRMGETMCVSWWHQYGLPAKIVRPFHTYGPGIRLDDGRVFADFVSDIVNNRNIVMKSDGSAIRAFCYLADATVGFFQVLLEGHNGEAYNVGNDRGEISVLDLANLLVNLFPEKNLSVIRDEQSTEIGYLKSKITRNCPDISKIRSLGWQSRFSLEEGFKRTIRSYQ
jgi:UDP-glucuronate decarboxylase